MNRPQHPSEYYRVGPLPIELFLPPDPDYCDVVTLPPDQPVVWDERRRADDIPGLLIEAGPHVVRCESWRPVMEALDATTLHDSFRQIVWTPACRSTLWRIQESGAPASGDPGFPWPPVPSTKMSAGRRGGGGDW